MALKGIKVIELAGLAPAPFCGMILADFGATVIRVDRPAGSMGGMDYLANGKKSIALNIKTKEGASVLRRMTDQADVLIDPYRRGVMEKLQLGPEDLMATNKKLVYARLTGYGQDGPYADMAGHDINYVALSGLLSQFGRYDQKPTPPVNLIADFGGGGLMCALGIVMALFERNRSGAGQVIDAAMVEGAAYLGSWIYRSQGIPGIGGNPRGKNLLDSGAHFYDTYETKDGKYMSVGALEPQFYAVLLEKLGLTDEDLPQFDESEKSRLKLTEIFKKKTQKEWTVVFDRTDACVTPVLSLEEATSHVHNKARGSFTKTDSNTVVPNPSPRLSRTPGITQAARGPNPNPGENSIEILAECGFERREIDEFISKGIVVQAEKQAKL